MSTVEELQCEKEALQAANRNLKGDLESLEVLVCRYQAELETAQQTGSGAVSEVLVRRFQPWALWHC